jgi:spore coat protein CotH
MTIKRSWWKRTAPVKVRHNLRLILGSVLILLVVGVMLNSVPITPIVFTHETPEQLSNSRYNISGEVDLFDLSIPHSIDIKMSDDALQKMAEDYQNQALKTWVEADVTIDGTLIESVGVRLKGNSTLRALGNNSRFGRGRGRNWNMSNASFDNPSTLPMLLSFDKFEKGRAYQGREELAIRPVKDGSTNLNEALALQLIADSGQPSQHFSWTNFAVNDYSSATRLVLENPDKRYADSLGLGSGVLYKSRSQNRFFYLGDDQTRYQEDMDQINAKKTHGLVPVIELLKWLDSVSPEDFDRELADWVNIPSFALYVATQDLFGNFDDMSGPGKNFLLWYDLVDEKFSVISWDMNMALGGNNFLADRGGRFGFRSSNSLKEYFVRSQVFSDEIEKARTELLLLWTNENYSLFVLEELSRAVPVSDILSQQQIDADLEYMKSELEKIYY